MAGIEPIWALGLMSGTSMDGVDGAMVLTDGVDILEFGESAFRPYTALEVEAISAAQGLWPSDAGPVLARAKHVIETAHTEMIGEFDGFDVVGFHGQTLAHDPGSARSHQLGDGRALTKRTRQRVVWDFRSEDLRAGGEGAPLAPFFHFACARFTGATAPTAFLNLGGVGNITLVDPRRPKPEAPGALLAFDTGPANAPINDLVKSRLGWSFDEDGNLAAQGTVHEAIISRVFQRRFFSIKPPKSLDRNDFSDVLTLVADLPDADAAATLCALCAACVAEGTKWFETGPQSILVSGGGAKNPVLMRALSDKLDAPVTSIEDLGLDGDMLEAQAFAYLAVRVLRGLPTSAPGTTGCSEPICGGQISDPF